MNRMKRGVRKEKNKLCRHSVNFSFIVIFILLFYDSHQKESKQKWKQTEWKDLTHRITQSCRGCGPVSIPCRLPVVTCLSFVVICCLLPFCFLATQVGRIDIWLTFYLLMAAAAAFHTHTHRSRVWHCILNEMENPFCIDLFDSFILVGTRQSCTAFIRRHLAQSFTTHTVVKEAAAAALPLSYTLLLFICIIIYFIVECVLLFRETRARSMHASMINGGTCQWWLIWYQTSKQASNQPIPAAHNVNGNKVIHFRVGFACECGLTELFVCVCRAIEMLHFSSIITLTSIDQFRGRDEQET